MAGTITQAYYELGMIRKVVFTCTADSSNGSYPDTAFSSPIDGYILQLATNPGATAPTANYDIVVDDADGIDILQGVGANRHTSSSEVEAVVISLSSHPVVTPDATYTLKITNNSVNSAITVITIFYSVASS